MLEAFEKVSKLHPNLKLIFVGSPPPNQDFYLEYLKQLIEKSSVSKQIEIIPFQNNIHEIWQAIDIAVVPSTEPEPFGLVAIEAMAARKPVIAANHGGLTEIIEDGVSGLLFKPNHTKDLVNSLDKLINNSDFRNQISEQGYQRVSQLFSIDGYVKSIQNIFNSI
jgi:glycosyltransferase involved in cell wall biosynthesis